jgi:hypothetical protein
MWMDEAGDGRKPLSSRERCNVGKIEKANTDDLGVKVSGSARKGHAGGISLDIKPGQSGGRTPIAW